MSRASEFTAVPVWGGILMGLSALVTGAHWRPVHRNDTFRWVLIWLADAVVAATIALVAIAIKVEAVGNAAVESGPGAPLRARVPAAAGRRQSFSTPVFALTGLIARLPGAGCCCMARRSRPAAPSR
jgi:hypothetical protein